MTLQPVFEPVSGMSFGTSVEKAAKLARDLERESGAEKDVTLLFSGVALNVKKDSDEQTLWREFQAVTNRNAELAKPAAEARLKNAQDIMTAVMARMDSEIAKGSAATFSWLEDYAPGTSFIGVEKHKDRVMAALTGAGYVSNEYQKTGMTFDEAVKGMDSKGNAERYAIGQLMYFLNQDAPLERIAESLTEALHTAYPPDPAVSRTATRIMRPLSFKSP